MYFFLILSQFSLAYTYLYEIQSEKTKKVTEIKYYNNVLYFIWFTQVIYNIT